MRKERKIINTNIRLNLCDEQDRQAWEYLQTMDRQKYKSYTKAVVAALNDYFAREYRNEEDPYLESREKEDAFLERVETAIRDGVKESAPMAIYTSTAPPTTTRSPSFIRKASPRLCPANMTQESTPVSSLSEK